MKYLIIIVLLVIGSKTYAQFEISGMLQDESATPISFANIVLLKELDSAMVSGTTSDEFGAFRVGVPNSGKFLLKISYLGFQEYIGPVIEVRNKDVRLQEKITLLADNMALDEIVITGMKTSMEKLSDRTVVHVGNNSMNAGSSMLRVIETLPGVLLDRASGKISMNGRGGVAVYIDGKRSVMDGAALVQLLNGLTTTEVKSIELITNPPAHYDAEGSGGVINIVSKDKGGHEGYRGTVEASLGYGSNTKYIGGFNGAYSKNGFTLYASITTNNNYREEPSRIFKSYNINDVNRSSQQYSDRQVYTGLHKIDLGANIGLSEKASLGLRMDLGANDWIMDARTESFGFSNDDLIRSEEIATSEKNNWKHLLLYSNFKYQFNEETTLRVDYDFLNYKNNNDAFYDLQLRQGLDLDFSEFLSSAQTKVDFHVAKLDINGKLFNDTKLEAGIKSSWSRFDNTSEVVNQVTGNTTIVPDSNNFGILNEHFFSAYVNLNFKFADGFDLNFGERYAYGNSSLTLPGNVKKKILGVGVFFPSVTLNYTLDEKNSIGLLYGERIERPNFFTLFPSFFYFDSNTILIGNPEIKPVLSKTLTLEYKYKKASASLYFSSETNPYVWGQPSFSEDFEFTTLIPQQMKGRKNMGLTLFVPIDFSNNLRWQTSLTGIWQEERPKYKGQVLVNRGTYALLNSSVQYRLNDRFQADASFTLNSERYAGLGTIPTTWSLNLGGKYSFNDRFSIALAFRDIFDTNDRSYFATRSVFPENNAVLDWQYFFEGRVLSFSMNYRLNRSKKRVDAIPKSGSEEEKKRVY
ncbi:outer membrane beta-barrel family protein [Flagellimonas allohymeniacidonis]|uniref:Outer membrane protein beta-barrel domain-containing protein n=1 Tax=Flagellimonas allohymeniacidonis TaxID=2517819 RepID=A0A4Q8QLV4_9FLAO|nr:outer membrane beta-barrel family protein [Allomuricauda hymeniacidonis]TAI49559.1 hypothetical protein EW142_07105 [Allomuricauda hymeniacidonis]